MICSQRNSSRTVTKAFWTFRLNRKADGAERMAIGSPFWSKLSWLGRLAGWPGGRAGKRPCNLGAWRVAALPASRRLPLCRLRATPPPVGEGCTLTCKQDRFKLLFESRSRPSDVKWWLAEKLPKQRYLITFQSGLHEENEFVVSTKRFVYIQTQQTRIVAVTILILTTIWI